MKMPGRMLWTVLMSLFKKPATVMYPAVKVKMPDQFRGKLVFDADKCIGCKLCVKDCPSDAITINKVGDKRFECVIDLARCIYCAQCVDSCPRDAMHATAEFELASLTRDQLTMVFHAKPAPPPAEPSKENPAQAPKNGAGPENKA
jgi:formate hydrogenlyase subunit 6/NADH:ubiquinone oxidoreductase subunit I